MLRQEGGAFIEVDPGEAGDELFVAQAPPAHAARGGASPLLPSLTVSLVSTYERCSSTFQYGAPVQPPPRVLTTPSEPTQPHGWDNANHDLIVAVGDVFISTLGTRYTVHELLGRGTFGQVFKCAQEGGEHVAVKVIKNQPAYYHQARVEIGILQYLNTRADPDDCHHIVRLRDFYVHRNHLCLVFELLSLNLFELVRHNKFRGLSLPLVRVFLGQILEALAVLRASAIIHCDLKPENVLLCDGDSGKVKLIDFGSACFENRTVYSYIQSRFYRSPEVVVGHPYTMAVDMWSLGCLAAELFLGLPLFPGACEHDLLSRMVRTLGALPDTLLVQGKHTLKHFKLDGAPQMGRSRGHTPSRFALRPHEEFERVNGVKAPRGKQYFQHLSLADIVGAYPPRPGLSDDQIQREKRTREAFTDFLLGVLDLDPLTRWTPQQAQQHPFVTGEPFRGPFQPAPDAGTHASFQRDATAVPMGSSPAGAPILIPQGPRVSIAASGASWTDSAAAVAMMASSPQIHAQAHAAALAAVQAQINLQQGHSATAASGLLYGWQPQDGQEAAAASYNPVHSLQQILPSFATAMAGSASSQGASLPFGSHLGAQQSMLSPPSRSFGVHLRYAAPDGGLAEGLDIGSVGSHGVVPLLQTPTASAHGDFASMSFQPSSINTYRAALAAAGAAMAQRTATGTRAAVEAQQQQAQQARLPPPRPQAGTAAAFVQAQRAHGAAALQAMPSELLGTDDSMEGNPGKERPPSAVPADSPNPSDWDPLWSDDILQEDEAQPWAAAAQGNNVSSQLRVATSTAPPAAAPSPVGGPQAATGPPPDAPGTLSLAAEHLTQLQQLRANEAAAGVPAGAPPAAAGPSLPPSMQLDQFQGVASGEAMLWSPPRAPATAAAPGDPPSFEPLQRLHGFEVTQGDAPPPANQKPA